MANTSKKMTAVSPFLQKFINWSSIIGAVEKFEIDYVCWSMKPFTWGIDRALKEFHFEKNEVVMVGDQLMTDIRAAHRAGIRSILVKPLVEHDSLKTQINRARERRVLKKITEKYGSIEYKKGI